MEEKIESKEEEPSLFIQSGGGDFSSSSPLKLSKKAASLSVFLKQELRNQESRSALPLPLIKVHPVSQEALELVHRYLRHHDGEEPKPLPCPVRTTRMSKIVSDLWDSRYIDNIDEKTVFEIILAAHYMQIKSLLHLGCAKIATVIKQLTQKQINAIIDEQDESDEPAISSSLGPATCVVMSPNAKSPEVSDETQSNEEMSDIQSRFEWLKWKKVLDQVLSHKLQVFQSMSVYEGQDSIYSDIFDIVCQYALERKKVLIASTITRISNINTSEESFRAKVEIKLAWKPTDKERELIERRESQFQSNQAIDDRSKQAAVIEDEKAMDPEQSLCRMNKEELESLSDSALASMLVRDRTVYGSVYNQWLQIIAQHRAKVIEFVYASDANHTDVDARPPCISIPDVLRDVSAKRQMQEPWCTSPYTLADEELDWKPALKFPNAVEVHSHEWQSIYPDGENTFRAQFEPIKIKSQHPRRQDSQEHSGTWWICGNLVYDITFSEDFELENRPFDCQDLSIVIEGHNPAQPTHEKEEPNASCSRKRPKSSVAIPTPIIDFEFLPYTLPRSRTDAFAEVRSDLSPIYDTWNLVGVAIDFFINADETLSTSILCDDRHRGRPRCIVSIKLARKWSVVLINEISIIFMLAVLSMFVFAIEVEEFGDRCAQSLTLWLAIVMFNTKSPTKAYLTQMDYYQLSIYVFLFAIMFLNLFEYMCDRNDYCQSMDRHIVFQYAALVLSTLHFLFIGHARNSYTWEYKKVRMGYHEVRKYLEGHCARHTIIANAEESTKRNSSVKTGCTTYRAEVSTPKKSCAFIKVAFTRLWEALRRSLKGLLSILLCGCCDKRIYEYGDDNENTTERAGNENTEKSDELEIMTNPDTASTGDYLKTVSDSDECDDGDENAKGGSSAPPLSVA